MWRYVCVLIVFLVSITATPARASEYSERLAAMAEIQSVRIATEADHVRIVVDITKKAEYRTMSLDNPKRLVVDVKGAWLGKDVVKEKKLDSPFVSKVRLGQHNPGTVRIVIESEAGKDNLKIFPLSGGKAGQRIVMDIGKTVKKEKETPVIKTEEKKGTEAAPAEGTNKTDVVKETDTEPIIKEADEDDNNAVSKEAKKKIKGVKGKIIVVDPGHGGEDSGAIGPSGVMEKNITLQVALQLQELLEDAEAKVIMTRKTDTEVSPKHRQATDVDELQARCDVANKAKADMFISVHMDSFTNATAKGTTGYYYAKGTAESKKLAAAVQKHLVGRLGTLSRGVKTCNFYVVKHTTMPATLIEVAFVSNQAEEKLMTSAGGVKKAAKGIFEGIVEFFA